jgi:hypothetical protein
MGVNMSMVVFWVEIPCGHTGWCYHFGRMLVPTCISTWHHSPEDYHGKRISAFTNFVAERERDAYIFVHSLFVHFSHPYYACYTIHLFHPPRFNRCNNIR